ncbi:DNA polymerase/3'-5' exonuclease PolX [Jeotgalibacillus proteolyticus]|uniref:DNA-directed DNA polymerase n=1 Tax=Jeotgalibacillus proteolyticus TaxID=2082395 RepID=A0A2S5GEW4_9BACL|nr:DNA polymerase/3'-5' exonuclease PolX [Jeotgalibacillus proteolyticus]PPA71587.1 DNA polymerase/3'-5' exonuclease PolX [Jeotgalibacillus proteolyticus]
MNKKDLIKLLETIAIYMELKGENSFKISAFRKAALAIETDDRSLSEIDDFTALKGVGKGTAGVIEEFLNIGESSVLKSLKEEVPEGLVPLLKLPGLGGKKIAKLYQELDVKNAEDLKKACEEHKVQGLAGFGAKTEEKILAVLGEAGKRPERLAISFMLQIAEELDLVLEKIEEVQEFSRAGSLRRARETIKDLDYIVATDEPAKVRDALLNIRDIKEIVSNGDTKVSVILERGWDVSVDIRLVKKESFATTLHHFTGSKDHNVKMRQLAKERGEKISEYGVESVESGEIKHFSTEEDFFAHFDLSFIPPEVREDGREVEKHKEAAGLISLSDIKGDLHMHTTWSDGAYSLTEMIDACRAKGYEYMAITDHSHYLKVANGLSAERLKKQMEEIKELNTRYTDIEILAGVEMDILPDGTLDYDDDLLAELDLVIASIHSSFSQSQEKIMARLTTALENPHVDIIAHPTGRLIGRREGYRVDMEALIDKAAKTKTALELNANPNRLDLSAQNVQLAMEKGVPVVINTDAHDHAHLSFMEHGIKAAKKGWLTSGAVLNTRSWTDLSKFLNRHM